MTRKQTILAVTLAIQVLLLVFLKVPLSGSAEAGSVRPFLPQLQDLEAARMTIEDGEGATVGLSRQGDGWTLDQADGYPADESKVDSMMEDLRQLKVRRPVVTSSRYHAQLKVADDEHERRIRIWSDPAGDPAVDFLVGASPNYRISDVRREGEDEVYEVMGLSAWDVQADTASWIDKKLVDVPADEVTGLKVTNGNGSFLVEKQAGTWVVAEGAAAGELDQAAVDSLVRAYSSIFLAEPVGKVDPAAHGLEDPAAVVELIRGGAAPAAAEGDAATATDTAAAAAPVQITQLSLGSLLDEESGKRYATVSGLGFTVTLNKFDAERATDKKLADLMVSEPEAE